MPNKKTLNGITGLRWIAAFYVFLFHIDRRLPLSFLPEAMKRIISQGALGVTLFFVLSGFILAYTYHGKFEKEKVSYGTFMYKRLSRIYPSYVTGWLLCILVSVVFSYYPDPFAAVTTLDLFALQSYIPSLAMKWYGSGAWSISVEFFFYLLFPFVLPILMKLSKKALKWTLLFSIGASILPAFALYVLRIPFTYPQIYCFPPMRFPEFLSGMCTALLVFRHGVRIKNIWPPVFLLLFFASLVVVGYRLNPIGCNFIAVPTIVSLLAIFSVDQKPVYYRWIESRVMVYLGKISYGFYIMQLPLMMAVDILLERKMIDPDPILGRLVIFAINLLMCILLYHLIEHPAHTYLNKRLSKKKVQLRQEGVRAA